MNTDSRILLVGCGKMGGALLRGWLRQGLEPADVHVVEPAPEAAEAVGGELGVTVTASPDEAPAGFAADTVVFAVKPQGMDGIVPHYRGIAGRGAVCLSIAAGKPIAFFRRHLGDDAAIVRAMPNTPAAVSRGITAACASAAVTAGQRAVCQRLLEAVGETVWLEDEALIDPVTAVSGSGPAYVFLLIEAMAQAGIEQGLPPDVAERLARATVAGSGELARQSGDAAETLRRNVTSPGGTTAAALEVLMSGDGLGALMSRAVEAATRRSRELAG